MPVTYLAKIKGLVGEGTLYPSRSELVRVAVREFLQEELRGLKTKRVAKPSASEENGVVTIPAKTVAVAQMRRFRLIQGRE